MSISPHLAAHHILSDDGGGLVGDFTPLKLIKLVYIAHGYHLAITDNPLINENIEAWRYGPVVKEIYHAVKDFRNGIPKNLFEHYKTEVVIDKSEKIIKDVVSAYGKYNGLQLSTATHQKGTPWDEIYKRHGNGATIPNDVIKKYYKGLLE